MKKSMFLAWMTAGCLLLPSPLNELRPAQAEAPAPAPLLVTELLPNSTNVEGSDGYEFIELYNNSSQPLSLQDYKIVYGYPSGGSAEWAFEEAKQIAPGEAMVVWIKNTANSALTQDAFNAEFHTALTDQHLTYIQSAGMANGSARTVSVADADGNVLVTAAYAPENVTVNNGIQYKLGEDGKTMHILDASSPATPGSILDEQKPEAPAELDTELPAIAHTPAESAAAGEDVVIRATVTDNTGIQHVKVNYRSVEGSSWTEAEMTVNESGEYEAVIPASDLLSGRLTYQIEAFDGQNTAQTEEFTLPVSGFDFDAQAVPDLLVTELVPDSTNVNRLDGFEFIEIYNNTDREISLKDYVLRYRYPAEGPEADLVWKSETEDLVLPSGEALVYWIINAGNQEQTVADFNANYGTALVENVNIVKVKADGMANGSARGVAIATNTGTDIAAAFYFDEPDVDDTAANKGIFYSFPRDGSTKMLKYSSGTENATPGEVAAAQVPAVKKQVVRDEQAPVVTDFTETAGVSAQQNINLTFDVSDDRLVKTVRLHYKTKEENEFTAVDLVKNDGTGLFSHTVYSPDLLGKNQLSYYVEATDGTNNITLDTKHIAILNEETKKTGLNVEDGSLLSKTAVIKAYGAQSGLLIDGQDVTAETADALPGPAYFAFDAKKVNLYFKNGVTIGEETLHIFDNTINTYETITVPVDPAHFKKGEPVQVSIRSGTKVSPFDENSEENRDDFYVKNVRLVLEDGTTLRDPAFSDEQAEMSIGDGASAQPVRDFEFEVPENKFTAKAYAWDTTTAEDGSHVIEAAGETAVVQVDNSAPVIVPSVEEGKEYKGAFTIQAEAEDASAIDSLTAVLDGEEIVLPLETSSAQLSPGAHAVSFAAEDRAGNKAETTVSFAVAEEQPYAPEAVSPADGAQNVNPNNAKLQVKVTDPTEDALSVEFYRGYEYTAGSEEVRVFENSAAQEPPEETVPAGETEVADKEKMAAADGEYVETKSIDQFPYHRFEVAVGEQVDDTDWISLHWEGKSLIGRKVSMYVWNHAAVKWEVTEWKVAQNNENFHLSGRVKGPDYVKNGKVQVMVQDEIAAGPEFDYSFVWMSDTQYYSESYPHIFDRITKWIAEQKEALNVKYVFHTGDLVDEADQPVQWERADGYMRTLDEADVPYGVLAGNHDVGQKTGDYTEYGKYFGEARFAEKDYYGESYKNNRGHYDLVSANGNDFIMLYMGWGANEEDMAWMNKVLQEHPDRKAILSLHEYLLVSGNRSPVGDQVFEQVVKPNPNVIAVLSGHYHDSETLVDELDDNGDGTADRNVYQMLADYQGGPEGGQGFIRLIKVNPVENRMYLQTYSPYLDKFNYYNPVDYPGKDEFAIEVDLTPKEKVVATDAFHVGVYTDEKIGSQSNVSNGETAEAKWKGIEKSAKHGWYVTVSDAFGGMVESDIWTFETRTQGNSPSAGKGKSKTADAAESLMEKTPEAWILMAEQNERSWTISASVIDGAAEAALPLQLKTASGHAVVLPEQVVAQLSEENKVIFIQLAEQEKTKAAGSRGQSRSKELTVTIQAGEEAITEFDMPVELIFPLDGEAAEAST